MGRPAHRATTANVAGLFPFLAGAGLGTEAPYIGQDGTAAFCFDPWELYPGYLTNPNILVLGQLGRGKSALVKTMIMRGALFGRRAAVLDPKGEYHDLAAAFGVEPIRLSPGGTVRLNPLDAGPGAAELTPREVQRRRLTLLQSIVTAALKRDLRPIERTACRIALEAVSGGEAVPTVPQVAAALMDPGPAAAAEIRTTPDELARSSHDVALELRRLCDGDLAGMFDGPTTVDIDWDGPLVVLDLSQMLADEGLAILMACATAWIQAAVARPGVEHHYIVLDEAWRLLNDLGTGRWLRSSLKLARQYGVANLLVIHRLSDLLAAGDAGSEKHTLATGLLSDTETRIIYAQPDGEVAEMAKLLGLSRSDQERLLTMKRGRAIWKVGQTTHLVDHKVSEFEQAITYTDEAMETDVGAA
ncbi:MAG: ATP-binding protein [Acidimicrobiales bacterium]